MKKLKHERFAVCQTFVQVCIYSTTYINNEVLFNVKVLFTNRNLNNLCNRFFSNEAFLFVKSSFKPEKSGLE